MSGTRSGQEEMAVLYVGSMYRSAERPRCRGVLSRAIAVQVERSRAERCAICAQSFPNKRAISKHLGGPQRITVLHGRFHQSSSHSLPAACAPPRRARRGFVPSPPALRCVSSEQHCSLIITRNRRGSEALACDITVVGAPSIQEIRPAHYRTVAVRAMPTSPSKPIRRRCLGWPFRSAKSKTRSVLEVVVGEIKAPIVSRSNKPESAVFRRRSIPLLHPSTPLWAAQ